MPVFESGTLEALPWAVGLLLCSFAFALLRSSLQFSRTARVGSLARSEDERQRIESLLENVERLSSSASLLKVCCELLFVALVLGMMTGDGGMQWGALLGSVAIAGPALLFIAEFLPGAFARRYGDQLLLKVLPSFDVVQRPLQLIILVLDGLNSAIQRMLGVESETAETREIVEGLREVIEDSERRDDLNATERELIENVIEFSDVDVAEIMTPRTEIHGVDLEDGLREVIQVAASEGHSSIPVFEDNLDNIIGYVSARGIVQWLADGELESSNFRKNLRPVYFVPETKRVTDLLTEFRRGKRKMAIVLDEYGGTAGMVTLGDILREIVGDVGDEYDRDDPEPVHFTAPGVALIEASLRIPELNEAMELELSEEEDYETLGGFVLAEFGRFPRVGESFERGGTRYEVTDATDRRVLRVEVRANTNGVAS